MAGLSGITSLGGISKFKPNANVIVPDGYDVFLIAGQSNTFAGEVQTGSGDSQPSGTLDATDADIKQWGRHGGNNGVVITASEPLHHVGTTNPAWATWVGWSLTFAKQYKANGYLLGNRKILLVPCGQGSTGFARGNWNPGDANYNDAISRTNAALATGSGTNTLKGILWHQGEDDSDNETEANAHQAALLAMVDAMRTAFGSSTIPFVAGGMTPDWANYVSDPAYTYRQTVQASMINLPTNRTYTGYANPESPTKLLSKSQDETTNHYSGRSVRGYPTQTLTDPTTLGLAGRYWTAYLSALTNT